MQLVFTNIHLKIWEYYLLSSLKTDLTTIKSDFHIFLSQSPELSFPDQIRSLILLHSSSYFFTVSAFLSI